MHFSKMPCSLSENVAITDFSLYSIQLKVMEEEWKGRREKKKGDKDDEGRRGVKEGTKNRLFVTQNYIPHRHISMSLWSL